MVPVTPDVCTTSAQADLNDAAQLAKFRALFGGPTADRIVAGQPYPSVNNALRRAGVGPGGLKQHAGKVCATPYPVRHNGIDWGFATPEDGIAVTGHGGFGTYTITVPADTTTGNGAWTSVSEAKARIAENAGISEFTIDSPTANGHIHGAFTGPVGITLPADPTDLGPGTGDIVIHYSSVTEPMVHIGDGISARDDGRLTIAVNDLSLVSSLRIVMQGWDLLRRILPMQEATESMVRSLLSTGGPSEACDPDYTDRTLAAGEKLELESELFDALPGQHSDPLTHCATRHPGGSARMDGLFGNNRGAVMPIIGYGDVTVDEITTSGGLLASAFVGLWNDWAHATGRKLLLPPGGSVRAHPDVRVGSFEIGTDFLHTLPTSTLFLVLENLSTFLPADLRVLVEQGDCMLALGRGANDLAQWNSQTLVSLFNLARGMLDCVADYVEENGVTGVARLWFGDSVTVGQASRLYDRLKRLVVWLKIGQVLQTAQDAISLAAYDGTVTMRWREPEPPDPTVDDNGRPLLARCWTKSFSYDYGWFISIDQRCQDLAYGDYSTVGNPPTCSAQDVPQDAWNDWNGAVESCRLYNVLLRNAEGVLHLVLLESGGLVAHPIAPSNEDDFKADWPEWEWRANEFNNSVDSIGSPAVNDPLRLRNFTNGRGGNWLLREADGTAWWVDGDGQRTRLSSFDNQQQVARSVLTLEPAQWENDVCPYQDANQPPVIKVC